VSTGVFKAFAILGRYSTWGLALGAALSVVSAKALAAETPSHERGTRAADATPVGQSPAELASLNTPNPNSARIGTSGRGMVLNIATRRTALTLGCSYFADAVWEHGRTLNSVGPRMISEQEIRDYVDSYLKVQCRSQASCKRVYQRPLFELLNTFRTRDIEQTAVRTDIERRIGQLKALALANSARCALGKRDALLDSAHFLPRDAQRPTVSAANARRATTAASTASTERSNSPERPIEPEAGHQNARGTQVVLQSSAQTALTTQAQTGSVSVRAALGNEAATHATPAPSVTESPRGMTAIVQRAAATGFKPKKEGLNPQRARALASAKTVQVVFAKDRCKAGVMSFGDADFGYFKCYVMGIGERSWTRRRGFTAGETREGKDCWFRPYTQTNGATPPGRYDLGYRFRGESKWGPYVPLRMYPEPGSRDYNRDGLLLHSSGRSAFTSGIRQGASIESFSTHGCVLAQTTCQKKLDDFLKSRPGGARSYTLEVIEKDTVDYDQF
jgi:hypothetical protein